MFHVSVQVPKKSSSENVHPITAGTHDCALGSSGNIPTLPPQKDEIQGSANEGSGPAWKSISRMDELVGNRALNFTVIVKKITSRP